MASDITLLQDYLFYGLLSCDLFARFNISQEKQHLMQSEIEFSAIWQVPRDKKPENPSGIGLYVEMPSLRIPKPNGLQRDIVASIGIIEERNINMTSGVGTGVSAEELGEMALDFMYDWCLGFTSALTPEAPALAPAKDLVQGDGLITYRASVSMRREHHATNRCDTPTITEAPAGTFSLANGAATPDADIYFTTDQSFPGKAVATATKYVAPIPLAAGTILTYAAWKPAFRPSHVSAKLIT